MSECLCGRLGDEGVHAMGEKEKNDIRKMI
jgi:hypothetical protein